MSTTAPATAESRHEIIEPPKAPATLCLGNLATVLTDGSLTDAHLEQLGPLLTTLKGRSPDGLKTVATIIANTQETFAHLLKHAGDERRPSVLATQARLKKASEIIQSLK